MADALYVESSALVKLIIDEPESEKLHRALVGAWLVSSRLTDVEVHRAAQIADRTARAYDVLERCDLVAVDEDVLTRARELVSPRLRTLDAIHLATALKVHSRRFATYDRRLIEAASAEGLAVLHPGLAA